jgi:ribosomal protein S18 acetylase RimI-like enzyme
VITTRLIAGELATAGNANRAERGFHHVQMIRPARADDYASVAALFPELRVNDPVPERGRWVADLMRDTLVYERAGAVIGYVSFYQLSAIGHVFNLVVAPGVRRGGVGSELMGAAADRLRGAGVEEWHLNVKVDNQPAIRLYERFGMTVEHRSTAVAIAWADADRIPGDASLAALPIDPAEDDDIERALDLAAGRIAMQRSRARRVLVQLRDAECAPVGFAAFDPRFPGAYPFRVTRPAYAGTLLAALRPHARPGDLAVQLVVENDAALARELVVAGATVKLEMLHYSGRL